MLPLEHSAIRFTCIKRLLVLKTNLWSFGEWQFYIGFAVARIVFKLSYVLVHVESSAISFYTNIDGDLHIVAASLCHIVTASMCHIVAPTVP